MQGPTSRGPAVSPMQMRRLVLGKTQGEVARDAGVTKQALSRYERGAGRPHPKRIYRLAVAYGYAKEVEQFVQLLCG